MDEIELEQWQSEALGSFGVSRWEIVERRSVRYNDQIGHKDLIHITPDERRRNQQQTRYPQDDPFTNGAFKMLACVESDADSKALFGANEAKDDAELVKILEMMLGTFRKRVKAMKNYVTVERLYQLARKNEIGGNKVQLLRDRLKELDPNVVLVGDPVAAGAEDPDLQGSGPAANVPNVEAESAPRAYAKT